MSGGHCHLPLLWGLVCWNALQCSGFEAAWGFFLLCLSKWGSGSFSTFFPLTPPPAVGGCYLGQAHGWRGEEGGLRGSLRLLSSVVASVLGRSQGPESHGWGFLRCSWVSGVGYPGSSSPQCTGHVGINLCIVGKGLSEGCWHFSLFELQHSTEGALKIVALTPSPAEKPSRAPHGPQVRDCRAQSLQPLTLPFLQLLKSPVSRAAAHQF